MSSTEKIDEVIRQIAADPDFRERFRADPNAVLQGFGAEPLAMPPDSIAVVERNGKPDVLFLWEQRTDALEAAASEHKWPRRYYYLENRSDRNLNLETWALAIAFRVQDRAIAVKPNEVGSFSSATMTEILLNKCNLNEGSFLVRDNTNNKLLGESYNVTCGNVVNRWTATGKGDSIVCTESHPKE